jgi:hypothetical protein
VAVEVWDCSRAIHQATQRVPQWLPEMGILLREIDRLDDAVRAVEQGARDDSLFVCLVEYRRRSLTLFRALGRFGARYAILLADAQPYGNTAIRSALLERRLATGTRHGVRDWLVGAVSPRWLGVRPPELVIAGGERSLTAREIRVVRGETCVLWAHALDYDRFLAMPPATVGQRQRRAVFLDQFLEDHPDQHRAGVPFCDPRTYYSNLQRVFESLESSLGVEVVIAAHPASDYAPRDARFGGREIVRDRTVALVAGSRLVLAHDSTAVAYAVLAEVPVTFITDEGIGRSEVRRLAAQAMAAQLGRRLYNLDRDPLPDWDRELEVDARRYTAYRNAYIKRDDTPNLPLWHIVAGHLRGEIPAARFGDVKG